MAGFFIDEDLPRSLAAELRQLGFTTSHVCEVGLSWQPDDIVLSHALNHEMTLVTSDVGFSGLHLATSAHFGIMIGRFHETVPNATRRRLLVMALTSIDSNELPNSLFVIEPGSLRRHRKK